MLRLLKKKIQDLAKISQDKFIIRSYREKSSRFSWVKIYQENGQDPCKSPSRKSVLEILERSYSRICSCVLLLGVSP